MTTPAHTTPARTFTVLAAALCLAIGGSVLFSAQKTVSAQAATLTGVWTVTITPRNCETNVPVAPPFRTLLTFHRDGTVTESVGTAAFAPGQRSAGHGQWRHAGAMAFDERTVAMILFDGGFGYKTGSQITTRTLTLTDENHYTGTGSAEFFDMNGESYRIGCATSAGVRFE